MGPAESEVTRGSVLPTRGSLMSFFTKLEAAARRNDTLLCVGLDPTPEACPPKFLASEHSARSITKGQASADCDALLRWNRAIIEDTSDLVCCYKPNIAFYEALGEPGMALLRDTIDAIPNEIPLILDAKRGDTYTTAEACARACFEELQADAVTLSPYMGADSIAPFAEYVDKGLFVLCHTSNPSAATFQELIVGGGEQGAAGSQLFQQVAAEAVTWSPRVGLVVGATYPQAIEQARCVAPDAWILAPGVGAQGGNLEAALASGLRADGQGLLISTSRSVTRAPDPRSVAQSFHRRIRVARRQVLEQGQFPPSSNVTTHRGLIIGLAELGALQFGDFTLASGKSSSIYVDLRLLVSQPSLMQKAARAYTQKLGQLQCDRIAGIPYAALPIGAAVSLASGIPLIYNRKETKSHGLGKDIEGIWQPGERVVVIEDVITTGGSIMNSVDLFRSAGLVVEDAVVLLDRQQGGVENLRKEGIRVHSVLVLDEVLQLLTATEHIPQDIQKSLLESGAMNGGPAFSSEQGDG